jgi:hypothetical protein
MPGPIKVRQAVHLNRKTMKEEDKIKITYKIMKTPAGKVMIPDVKRKR